MGLTEFPSTEVDESPLLSARNAGTDLPIPTWPTGKDAPYPVARSIYPAAPPLDFKTKKRWCRNINLLSIIFGFRLRLRTD